MPGETVLVIDDSPTILKVVQLVLTKAQYRVETAADGEEGLERARALTPALILLDFVMPRMNGYQFCREMANEPKLRDIPIVLMSAKGDQVGERFIKVMGIVDYITKPFSPEAITAVVQHSIAKYALPNQDSPPSILPKSEEELAAAALDEAARKADTERSRALASARARIAGALEQALGEARARPADAAAAAAADEPGAPTQAGEADAAEAEGVDGPSTIEFPEEMADALADDEDGPTMSLPSVSLTAALMNDETTAVGGPPRPSAPRAAALAPEESTELIDRAALESGALDRAIGQPPPLPAEPAGAAPVIGDVRALAEAALPDELLAEVITDTSAALRAWEIQPSLIGDLRVVPIADVLQLLDAQDQSGILSLRSGTGQVEIFFRKGRVDLAVATKVDEEFLLGRFIVALGLMGQEDFDGFLASRAPSQKLIGQQLVKLDYISESDLTRALTKQTSELVYETLRWRAGTFEFRSTRELPANAVQAALAMDVAAILMDGFRRVDEWHLIEREVDDFDVVFLRNEDALNQMGQSRLTREELAVLELVNGKNSVKDIVRRSRMGSFDVSKMLYRLLSIKLVRRRVAPMAV